MQTILALVLALSVAGEGGWSHTGGDAAGLKYSPADAITPGNANDLIEAWRFSTGDLERRAEAVTKRSKFETTPILSDGRLVFCSP